MNNISRFFFISGILYLNGKLDFESQRQYYLSIEGTRGSSPPLSDVTVVVINVTDINDHKPVFSQEEYQEEIPENAVVGDLVVMVRNQKWGKKIEILLVIEQNQ